MPTTADRTSVAIQCDRCSTGTSKPVGWLLYQKDMTCPTCGGTIDLRRAHIRLVVEQLNRECERIDSALASITDAH